MSGKEYGKWILNEFNWGGDLECDILSKIFNINIIIIDATTKKCYDFNKTDKILNRIYIINIGKHYDAVVGISNKNDDLDYKNEIRIFNEKILNKLKLNYKQLQSENILGKFIENENKNYNEKMKLLNEMKSKRKFKCQDCDKIFSDDKDIKEHMQNTNWEHCMFDQIN